MSLTFDEILSLASLPEDTVTLCLDGRTLDEVGALQRQLAEAPAPTSLADDTAARLREQLAAAAERMRAAQVAFHLRALPSAEWATFYATSPDRGENETAEQWAGRIRPWLYELVARTCYDPAMSAEQVEQLAGRLHTTSWSRLSDGCWLLNRNEVALPNFDPVSDGTPRSTPTSEPASSSASPTPVSGVGSPAAPRPTGTTTADASPVA